jgi:hypothetical protein
MAITETGAELQAIGNSVGLPNERIEDLEALGAVITDTDSLKAALNEIGYYDEKADHLEAAGLTVGP